MASNMISFYFLCILRKVQHILQRLCFFICTWSIFFENFDLVLFGFIWFYLFPHPDDHLPGDVAQNDDFYFISYFILLFFILFLIYLFPYQDAHLSGNGVNHVDFLYLISYLTLFYFNPYLFIYLFICFLTLTTISLAMVSSTFFVCFVYLVIFLYLFGSSIYWFDNWLPYRDDHLFGDGVQHDDVIWYLILFDKFYFSIIYLFAFPDDPSLQRRRDGVWHGDFISFCYFILFCFFLFPIYYWFISPPQRSSLW